MPETQNIPDTTLRENNNNNTENIIGTTPSQERCWTSCSWKCGFKYFLLILTAFEVIYSFLHAAAIGIVIVHLLMALALQNLISVEALWHSLITMLYFSTQAFCFCLASSIFYRIYTATTNEKTKNQLISYMTLKLILIVIIVIPLIFLAGAVTHGHLCHICVFYAIFEVCNAVLYYIAAALYFRNPQRTPPRSLPDFDEL